MNFGNSFSFAINNNTATVATTTASFNHHHHHHLLAPLSIVPVNIEQHTARHDSNKNGLWSPFSTPNFSPYSQPAKTTTFQYSNPFFSPNNNTSKSPAQRSILGSNSRHAVNAVPLVANKNTDYLSHLRGMGAENRQPPLQTPPHAHNHTAPITTRAQPKRSDQVDMRRYIEEAAAMRAQGHRLKACTFCKSNGEAEYIYMSHALKDAMDRVTCPVLQCYSCPVCGASGELTHTKKYCPLLQKRIRREMLASASHA